MKNNTMKSPKVITKTKKFKSVISSICIVALLLSFSVVLLLGSNLSVYASYDDNEKIPCTATLSDSFSEDRVLVILSSEASSSSHIYDKDDFNIEKCESVTDLSGSPNTGSASNNNKTSFKRVLSLELADSSKEYVLEVISELIERDDVIYAGPDYKISAASTTPDDEYARTQWAIDSLSLPQVWDFTTGSKEVLVGVLDSGIDGNHPDLMGSIVTNLCMDFTSGEEEGVAVDEVTDPNGHGTHVAGIIGAAGNNSLGVAGSNWNVGLVSLRVLDEDGYGDFSNIVKAIKYAGEKNIPILNISVGFGDDDQDYENQCVLDIISNYSGLIVCAAGNSGRDNDNDNVENNGYPTYPASLTCDNIISVGSINQYDERSVFDSGSSNYGAISVDVYAPGSDILSTYPEDLYVSGSIYHNSIGYRTMSGTSMAAPYVAGIAALLLSVDPDLTTSELKSAIINSSETITISVPGGTQDVKKVNALSALRYVMASSTTFLHLGYDEETVSKTIDGTSTYFIEKNAMIRLVVGDEDNYNFEASSDYPINVALYDYDLNLISTDVVYSNGNCDAEFCENLSLGTYYLRISYVNETSGTININIHGPSHQHSYTEWIYYDRISHIEVCECGTRGTRIAAHVVSQADLSKPRARCLGCNALLNLNGDIGIVPGTPLSINRSIVTENGSFILPSGIIVLVEEDIEAYLNGTLIFYDEGETLVTQ